LVTHPEFVKSGHMQKIEISDKSKSFEMPRGAETKV